MCFLLISWGSVGKRRLENTHDQTDHVILRWLGLLPRFIAWKWSLSLAKYVQNIGFLQWLYKYYSFSLYRVVPWHFVILQTLKI